MKKISNLFLLFFLINFSRLVAQPLDGKSGSRGSYKTQEYCNVLAENKDIKEGAYELWYNGIRIVSGNFSNNEKEGFWKFNNIKSEIKSNKGNIIDSLSDEIYYQGNYDKGKKNGVWKYYLNKKPLCVIYYKNDSKDSLWKSFYKNGNKHSLVNFKDGYKNGMDERFDEMGNKSFSALYRNDTLAGSYIIYNSNGQIRLNIEYKNGAPFTVFALNDLNGHPLDPGTIKNGNGSFKTYGAEDVLYMEESYINGLKDGTSVTYFTKSGKINIQGEYKKGKKIGNWDFYNTKGDKFKTISYKENATNSDESVNISETGMSEISFFAERLPEPQGGINNLQPYFESNINYFKIENYVKNMDFYKPTTSGSNIKEAKLSFVISSVGKIYEIKINRKLEKDIENDIIQALKSMPPWVPGFIDGFPVDFFQYSLLIRLK